ncbi:PREDICTED: uncharacterized protein LOC109581080 [Amphimedon queenslandica]|uniref:Uncharacterized protein n=1 Tax=Amphimedon queenslandica TaxID=400682 RepID=A0AAN0J068_AMPQE|nr:PREDICTED: uncharacterized protein LOC109581080 [Amphimedon queenslandica]XP_019850406.1 PREDICTED: uncharacterized protein LOC109581080 [Amphimedon queenslandica]|eukprot:XP_019850405.1 PREDICTED: uncharacterized protein LOC109581080 [Amphimedon queenslandica]
MSLSVVNGREEFKFLQEILRTAEIKKIVLDALLYYLSVDLKEDAHVITVINALPLYHFLSGLSVPNQISLKEAPCILNLVALNTLIEKNPNIFEMCCSTIFQLFQLDSQMLVLIPYFNCQKSLNVICEVLPIELSIVWLINLQSHIPNIYLSSVNGRKMEHDFLKPMTCIQQRIITIEIKKFSILSCYSEAAIYLVKSFKKNLDSSKNSELLVVSVVSLLLHILYRAKKFNEETNEFNEETNDQLSLCQKLRHTIQGLLMDWVMCPDVVGGTFFGGEVSRNYQEIRKKEEELKFWESI